ncbi:MAG: carbon starvation protein A, partial [Gemmataceae bacterium]|nr:carbon starvation protein A [Gemmataceae bacterium]
LQESAGRLYKPLGRPDWLPGTLLATALVTTGYGWLIYTGSIDTIWPMFGIANQGLAVLALALVTTWLINSGRGRYAWVTALPMLFVLSTTTSAAALMITVRFPAMIRDGRAVAGYLNIILTVFVVTTVGWVVVWALARWLAVLLNNWRTSSPSPSGS